MRTKKMRMPTKKRISTRWLPPTLRRLLTPLGYWIQHGHSIEQTIAPNTRELAEESKTPDPCEAGAGLCYDGISRELRGDGPPGVFNINLNNGLWFSNSRFL